MPKQAGTEDRREPPDLRSDFDRLEQLQADIGAVRSHPERATRVARLLAAGIPKMAKKVAEEGAEIAIDAVRRDRAAVVNETADLFYNLVVLLDELGIPVRDVWAEMDRRRSLYGIAGKLAKAKRAAGGHENRGPASSATAARGDEGTRAGPIESS